jgi:hypothetical protein
MTFIATLTVPATKWSWQACEVPRLTAGALYPVPETPEPPVRELLRIDMRDGRMVESTLSTEDRIELEAVWNGSGLPLVACDMTTKEWMPYIENFNRAPIAPVWQFAVRPPPVANMSQRILRTICEDEHTDALKSAIQAGDLQARHALSNLPAKTGLRLEQLVLTREAFICFCEMVGIEVKVLAAQTESESAGACAQQLTAHAGPPQPLTMNVRWTPEELKKLGTYRDEHGTKRAAKQFGISSARVRKLLPRDTPPQRWFSAIK